MHRAPAALVVALVLLSPLVSGAAWLDASSPAPWNQHGSQVPQAPDVQGNDDPRCRESERPAETPEDRSVIARGWRLFHDYQAGWGLKVIWALSGYDGMCRPWGYQVFVFVRGVFAGTLSPRPMDARTDASLFSVQLLSRRVGPALLSLAQNPGALSRGPVPGRPATRSRRRQQFARGTLKRVGGRAGHRGVTTKLQRASGRL
jgi:hypothetical protein